MAYYRETTETDPASGNEKEMVRGWAGEALREGEGYYKGLLETASTGVLLTDCRDKITFVNNKLAEMLGCAASDMAGHSFLDFIDGQWLAQVRAALHRPPDGESELIEAKLRRKDGASFWAAISVSPQYKENGDYAGALAIVMDFNAHKQKDEELVRNWEMLHGLAQRQEQVREEERKKIARDIHDELGQALTALKMDVRLVASALPGEAGFVTERIDAMSGLIDKTINSVRAICGRLRPLLLDDLGLAAAIEWQAQEFEKRTGIRCQINLEVNGTVPSGDRAGIIFRIFQEAMTNVARHAGAASVGVSMKKKGSGFVLTVKDDGKGISQSEISATNAFGLMGMRERARAGGGELHIKGAPGKGTTVTLVVPEERRRA